MALVLFLLIAVPLFLLTRWLLPAGSHSDLWLFIGLLISIWGNKVNRTLGRCGAKLLDRLRVPSSRPLGELLHYDYADLVALLFVTMELSKLYLASFQNAISQLTAERFLAFPRGIDGEIHLQLFVSGLIVLPSFGIALALYGLSRGLQLRPTRFNELALAFFGALACILGFIYATEGPTLFRDNYSLVQHANPGALPASLAFAVFARIAITCALVLVGTTYTWLFSKLGSALVRSSAKPNSSFTLQSVLVGLMLLLLVGAAGLRLLHRAFAQTPPSTRPSDSSGRAQIGVMDTSKLVVAVGKPVLAVVPLVNTGCQPALAIRTQSRF